MAKKSEGFEDNLKNLSAILDALESGELSLAQSLDQFEKGIRLYSKCDAILENANTRVSILKANLDKGDFDKEPFVIDEE